MSEQSSSDQGACRDGALCFDLAGQVQRWLELDEKIRLRLELPHGWGGVQIACHQADLREREDVKRYIRTLLEPGT